MECLFCQFGFRITAVSPLSLLSKSTVRSREGTAAGWVSNSLNPSSNWFRYTLLVLNSGEVSGSDKATSVLFSMADAYSQLFNW